MEMFIEFQIFSAAEIAGKAKIEQSVAKLIMRRRKDG